MQIRIRDQLVKNNKYSEVAPKKFIFTECFVQIYTGTWVIIFYFQLKLKGENWKGLLIFFLPTFDYAAAKVTFILAAKNIFFC